MDFKDIARANDMACQLTQLKQWLKNSWQSRGTDCQLTFVYQQYAGDDLKNTTVEIPFAPAREAVKFEIDRIMSELSNMGVDLTKLPD